MANNWLSNSTVTSDLLEMFTGLCTSISKVLVDQDKACRENTEEGSKSEHHKVSDTNGERRLASEHGFLPPVSFEGGQLDIDRRSHDAGIL
jgi:hypothetical protein